MNRRPLHFARSAEVERGTDAHFGDAAYYTQAYADRTEDIDYYLGLGVAQQAPVLEYGCGNGRIAIPLAHAGVRVTGVDRSTTMLADLRARLGLAPPQVRRRVELARGDMRRKKLRTRFGLVLCTFNTFLHLYTRQDVERFCARVREHLAPRGRFVVDVGVPDPEELARDPNRVYRVAPFRHRGRDQVVRYGERSSYHPLSQVLTVSMEFEPKGKPRARWVTPLCHRQFYPQELEALLHYNGLEVVDVHGDFQHAAPAAGAETLVFHCRARRGFPT